ncbi:MAG: UTP--glucose-1-phosphate uridylyltransferase [Phycisphaeraceae bacterium]
MTTPATDVTRRYDQAHARLLDVNQEHVLHFWETLTDQQRRQLLDQIDSVDWQELHRLIQTHVQHKPEFELPSGVEPAPWYPNVPTAALKSRYEQARRHGEELIAAGKVAAFTVAGGQGTRLGWAGPKGGFPATPIRGLPLFGCLAEYIQNMQARHGVVIPWYIMTSPINHADTCAFFQQQGYFGLEPAHVMLFPQGMMPAIEMVAGKVLLEAKDAIALSPNGHGGSLKALYTSGTIADMKKRGIEQISYTQVDNPIVRVLDPLFIGLHALDQAQMSSKMLPKREPLEKLGNFCVVDGRITVIEYSDLPEDLAYQRTGKGELRFLAGSIAIHLLRVEFVESLNTRAGGFALPFHRAEKKVPYIEPESEQTIKPTTVNAVKLETFVFDALPLCETSIIYETDRDDEFAPIKNAPGPAPEVLDSPVTSKLIQTARAARWLEAAGVAVPRKSDGSVDAVIEIKQTTAIYADDLRGKPLPKAIAPGEQFFM